MHTNRFKEPAKSFGGANRLNSSLVAFTLIELLVVVAIIGILAALLLPTLAKGKAQADSAYCKNNLREQGLALEMYVDEYKAYPYYSISINSPSDPGQVFPWEVSLGLYYRVPDWYTNRASQCPTYTGLLPVKENENANG